MLVNVLSDLFHFLFVFHLLLYSTVCYFRGSACVVLAPRSLCWVKEHPTVVFKDHESGERFLEVWLIQHRELHLKLSAGEGIYWREAYLNSGGHLLNKRHLIERVGLLDNLQYIASGK